MALGKKYLSHLADPKLPVPGLLPFEVYVDDFLEEAARLEAEIRERERGGKDRLKVEVVVHQVEGTTNVMADVVGYDAVQRKYKVQYQKEGGGVVLKLAGRLNMTILDRETRESVAKRHRDAKARRTCAIVEAAADKIVVRDLVHRYQLGMEEGQRARIRKKLEPFLKQEQS